MDRSPDDIILKQQQDRVRLIEVCQAEVRSLKPNKVSGEARCLQCYFDVEVLV